MRRAQGTPVLGDDHDLHVFLGDRDLVSGSASHDLGGNFILSATVARLDYGLPECGVRGGTSCAKHEFVDELRHLTRAGVGRALGACGNNFGVENLFCGANGV